MLSGKGLRVYTSNVALYADPHMASIGGNIRQLRIEKRFETQGAFAAALGVPQSRVSDWENDRYDSPDLTSLIRIATLLSVSIDALLAGVDARYDAIVTTGVHTSDGTGTVQQKTSGESHSEDVGSAFSSTSLGVSDATSIDARVRQLEARIRELEPYEDFFQRIRPIFIETITAVGGETRETAAPPTQSRQHHRRSGR